MPSMLSLLVAVFAIWCRSNAEASCTGASPSWTSTPDQSSVSTCIARASNGDTIVLTAGTADWSGGGVTLNKSLAIIGQGSGCPSTCDDATKIRVGSAMAFKVTASNWRISGITFEGAGNEYGSIEINAGTNLRATNWRVDHCHFKDTIARGITVASYASGLNYFRDIPGLIDNNRFSAPARNKAIEVYGHSETRHGSWDDPLILGGESFAFIEDNHFVHATMPDGVSSIDGDTGARMVIRFNTFINGDVTAHGLEYNCADIQTSGYCQWRSTHGWEIYGNTFTYNTKHSFMLNLRGGTGVIHGNTFSGVAGSFRPVRYFYERGDAVRSCLTVGACQGSSSYDGNQTGKSGYPCYQQIGVTGSNGITPMPVYQWFNSFNGSAVEASLSEITFEAGCNYQHVQFGRDVILMGISDSGPHANIPATCTVGDAYWATDQGEWNKRKANPQGVLYKCAAPNIWTLYYTPYSYPHPLQRASELTPPPGPGGSLSVR